MPFQQYVEISTFSYGSFVNIVWMFRRFCRRLTTCEEVNYATNVHYKNHSMCAVKATMSTTTMSSFTTAEETRLAPTIDLPLPGSAQGWLVPGGCQGRHGEVPDGAVAPGSRPHPVARTRSSQGVAQGSVSE